MLKKAKRATLSSIFSTVFTAVYKRKRQYSDSDYQDTHVYSECHIGPNLQKLPGGGGGVQLVPCVSVF